ncbi:MAG: hypothetical protein DWQ44_00695 [Bacteroidetes bacterium]|nr:MAG: hypothetical protein DWQ33_04070 [Bacteroidota bacterium]REK07538.1 MAG: hypothetical protein DWQ39_01200 [Bacteroidota bacterium]REK37029.1 MAG: hypothetical protein DWQ44_00695 [Bacteroidota bacterium]REK47851.1 MAG: hypothetical protein DWQ48_11760 [Bacteroidota bacterium]
MKKLIFSFIFILLISTAVCAQSFSPVKSTIEHEEKLRPCLMLKLDPEPTNLKNAWIDFLNDKYDFKLKGMGLFSNKELLSAEEVSIPHISTKKMNFYTHVTEEESASEMKVFASLGYDIYINEQDYPDEFNTIRDMMTAFLKQYLPQYYSELIEASSEKVKNLNKEIKDMNGEINDKQGDIEKLNKEIDELRKNVQEKSKELKDSEIQLRLQEDKRESVSSALRQL